MNNRKSGGSWGSGGNRENGDDLLTRPRTSTVTTIKIDKDEEERRMKMLLRDDFIDDDLTSEGVYVPVQLPMVDTGKLFKEEMEKEKEQEKENDDEVKTSKKKRFNRILDSDDDEEEDEVEVKVEEKKDAEVTFLDLVSKSKSGEMMFFQMPDHLPKLKATKIKTEDQKTNQPNEVKSSEEQNKLCSISDLPEGYLGNLIVRKSGRTQLRIGDDFFDVELGTQVGFLQDLVSVATPQREDNEEVSGGQVGEMTFLGRVRHRAVVTPDWDNLFQFEDQARIQGDQNS